MVHYSLICAVKAALRDLGSGTKADARAERLRQIDEELARLRAQQAPAAAAPAAKPRADRWARNYEEWPTHREDPAFGWHPPLINITHRKEVDRQWRGDMFRAKPQYFNRAGAKRPPPPPYPTWEDWFFAPDREKGR